MKKIVTLLLALVLSLSVGCAAKDRPVEIVDTITTEMATYYEMSDGTWQTDTHAYQYRLEISGRMHNAAKDSTFVYLSNVETIPFERAWKAAGLSSNPADYFSAEEAVLVDWK